MERLHFEFDDVLSSTLKFQGVPYHLNICSGIVILVKTLLKQPKSVLRKVL